MSLYRKWLLMDSGREERNKVIENVEESMGMSDKTNSNVPVIGTWYLGPFTLSIPSVNFTFHDNRRHWLSSFNFSDVLRTARQ